MKITVIVLFISPMVFGTLEMAIIIKYLNNKAIIKRNIQDQIQVDLAIVTLVYVYLYSSMFIACEVFGPLNSVTILNTALWIVQCLFNMGFNCIIALQFIQFCNIFGLKFLNDWSDFRRLILIRILVFPLGLFIGSGLCLVGAGSCRKTRIYNYFLMDTIKTDPDKSSILSGITWITYGMIILICQISVEIKRFLLNKADQKADNLAFFATKQLQDAMSKLKIQAPADPGAKKPQMSDTSYSMQGLCPRLFQRNKVTAVTRLSSKVLSDTEENQQYQVQELPDDYYSKDSLRDSHGMHIVDEIILSAVENLEDRVSVSHEILVQATEQNLYSIKNYGPNQEAFQAWEQNNRLYLEPTANHQIPDLVESNNKISRDQVKGFYFLSNK
jgi:hypothetical protein